MPAPCSPPLSHAALAHNICGNPTSANNFAMKQHAIEVRFTVDANGKGQGLVVLERGAIVAEATFTRA